MSLTAQQARAAIARSTRGVFAWVVVSPKDDGDYIRVSKGAALDVLAYLEDDDPTNVRLGEAKGTVYIN